MALHVGVGLDCKSKLPLHIDPPCKRRAPRVEGCEMLYLALDGKAGCTGSL